MSDIVIRAEGLGKRYRRGVTGPPETLRDALTRVITSPLAAMRRPTREHFWALRDVGLEVRHGEVLGLIGRNGAGKTTLLKILSRITRPTVGWAEIHGRVRSLLEVGTGFHGELSGRENTYLSGSILGMGKREIDRKFDEIVAFAEIDKFIDTPVKHYSSGMYVRLAFAVAAHLEPEILLVDEVLAVGDAEFQKKCLGKIDEVSRRKGRTVLLVSHNMAAITQMANRALLLDAGSVAVDGSVTEAVSTYLSRGMSRAIYIRPLGSEISTPHIARAEILTSDPNAVHRFGEPLEVKFWIRHPTPIRGSFCFMIFNSQFQNPVIHSSYYHGPGFGNTPSCSILVCRFPSISLNVGQFHLCTWLQEQPSGDVYETLDGICAFEVIRIDESPIGGWRPQICAYHERHAW